MVTGELALADGLKNSDVVAVIVTCRRPAELARLLRGLRDSEPSAPRAVVVDHAADGVAARLVGEILPGSVVVGDPSNPGPGAGWANGTERAFAEYGEAVKAIWYLDDDVVVAPDTLAILLREMGRGGGDSIAPLLSDAEGKLWAFPEPVPVDLRRMIRRAETPADALRLIGPKPVPFLWCTGACYLVRREVIDRVGLHRRDFWMLGEDLEFSMRAASRGTALFTCGVEVQHLPPPAAGPGAALGGYRKFCALLQNLCYLSFHSPHSHHLRRYLPGNFRRFFHDYGWRVTVVRDALDCLWGGAIMGQAAGGPIGVRLRAGAAAGRFRR